MRAVELSERRGISQQSMLLILLGASFSLGLGVLVLETFPLLALPPWLGLRFDGSVAIVLSSLTIACTLYGRRFSRWLAAGSLLFFAGANLLATLLDGPGRAWLSDQPRLAVFPSLMSIIVATAALLDGHPGWRRWGWYACAGFIGLACLIVFLGQLFGQPSGGQLTPLGILYCLAIALISVVLARIDRRPIAELPRAALAAGLFGGIISMSWWFLGSWAHQQERIVDARARVELARRAVESSLSRYEMRMRRLAMRWQAGGGPRSSGVWKQDVASYFDDVPTLQGLLIVGDGGDRRTLEAVRTPAWEEWLRKQLARAAVTDWLQTQHQSIMEIGWLMPDPAEPGRALLYVTADPDSESALVAVVQLDSVLSEATGGDSRGDHIKVARSGRILVGQASAQPRFQPQSLPLAQDSVSLRNGPRIDLSVEARASSLLAFGNLLPFLGGAFGLVLTHYLIVSRALLQRLDHRSRELQRSEQHFRSLFYQSPDAVFALDRRGRYQGLNSKAQEFLGVDEQKAIGQSFQDMDVSTDLPGDEWAALNALYRGTLAGQPGSALVRYRSGDGHYRDFDLSMLPIIVDGVVEGLYGIARDVTERTANEEQLRILYRSLEASSNAVLVVDVRDSASRVTYVNPAFSRITGHPAERVLQHSAAQLMASLQVDDTDASAMREAVKERRSLSVTLRNVRQDGQAFWNQLVLSPVRDAKGELTHYIAILNDISERKEQESRLAFQATHDALTGLANRSLFGDRLAHDCQLARRHGTTPVVMFIDLDEFKPINDTLGHRVGDKVLLMVAQRLADTLRPTDTLARFGGDEFLILLPDVQDRREAEVVAERLLKVLRKPYPVQDQELYISASIGMATLEDPRSDPERLVQQADIAMYRAKQDGRDTWQWFSADMDNRIARRVSLRNELQEAMDTDQLELHYQPLVTRSGSPCGLEALLRWTHPVRGPVSPAQFIPVAEETGQIMQLSEWVMRRACDDAQQLRQRGQLPGRMAVNLSPMQFHRAGFLDTLKAILRETGLPPGCLELEITEGILMRDTDGAIQLLQAIADLDIHTVIDDFGTGFSSLSYIRLLPVDKIKIDGSFVQGILDNDQDAAVCKAVIALARELHLQVVAEGVETAAQADYLYAHDCEIFQGYLFARPMPLATLNQWLSGESLQV